MYSFWQCVMKDCKGSGNLNGRGQFQPSKNNHNHPPDFSAIANRKFTAQLKTLALNSDQPSEVLVRKTGVSSGSSQFVKYVENIRKRKAINNARKKAENSSFPINVGANYEVLPTLKNHQLIIKDGFVYRQYQSKSNQVNQQTLYWKCRKARCKARGKTSYKGHLILTNPFHSHEPESNILAHSDKKSALTTAAFDTTKPLVEIYAEFEIDDLLTKKYLKNLRDIANRECEEMIDNPINVLEKIDAEPSHPLDTDTSVFQDVYNIEELLDQME